MATQIFVNLPVIDLTRSMAFFSALGFGFDAKFTDQTAACMIVSETIYVMLLTEEKFRGFTPKEICDARRYTEVLICLSCKSREQLDDLVRKAIGKKGPPTMNRRSTGSCMATDSRISTVTSGSWSA